MKKLIACLLTLAMVFCMAACAAPAAPAPVEPAAPAAPAEPAAPAAPEAPAQPAEPEGPAAANDPKVTLVYAEVNPETSLMGKTALFFADKVAELSGGSVTINVQCSAVLGAEGDVLEDMTSGSPTIDMARLLGGSLTVYDGVDKTSLLGCPYIFENREHFWKFAASDIGTEILAEPSAALGIHGMFYVEEGFRHFFFRDPITGIGDIAGKKIRVSTDAVMTGMVEGLGASPTVVAFNELYTALSSGVCDGAEQPIANYQSNSFNEVASYMILDAHTLGCGEVMIVDASWEKLTDAQKAAVAEAGRLTSEFNAGLSEENEETCKADLISKGATFVEVTNPQEWKDACADVIAAVATGVEDTYKAICDLA